MFVDAASEQWKTQRGGRATQYDLYCILKSDVILLEIVNGIRSLREYHLLAHLHARQCVSSLDERFC